MRTLVICGLAVGIAACAKSEYESEAAFLRAQEEAGFVRLGTFGRVEWPATVVEERTANNEISLTAPNGTPHTYPGYDGYTLKAVRLKGANGAEVAFVLRSK